MEITLRVATTDAMSDGERDVTNQICWVVSGRICGFYGKMDWFIQRRLVYTVVKLGLVDIKRFL